MRYFQVSESLYVNCDTYQFVPYQLLFQRSEMSEVLVPYFLWHDEERDQRTENKWYNTTGGRLKKATVVFRQVAFLSLNQFEISFNQDYKKVAIKLFDKALKKRVQLKLSATPLVGRPSVHRGGGFYPKKPVGCYFELENSGVVNKFEVPLAKDAADIPRFHHISELGDLQQTYGTELYMFGIDQHQFPIRYHGRELNGQSYIFICGPWGILLDDDLSFDSLVCLNSIRRGHIDIAHIAYTTNSYMMKVKVMMK